MISCVLEQEYVLTYRYLCLRVSIYRKMASNRSALEQLEDIIAELSVSTASLSEKSTASAEAVPKAKSTSAKPTAVAAAQPKAAASTTTALNINSIDFRVGRIVKVEKHASAEKLYVEEIDVGEEAPRPIASGLVPHYSLEEMQDRKIIVVCNLKPRNLVGFKSHGMVLCAAAEVDGMEKVEFVDPPADSKPGDRIIGEGLAGDPLTPNQVDKQKAFEALAPGLRVNEEGIAMWQDCRLVTTAGGLCTAPTIRNGALR
jgi:aminoacyl tRNA synthase complex-interacting multifunctional protein 1